MVSVSSLFLFYYFKYIYFIVFQSAQLSEALGMPFIPFVVSENLLMVTFSLYGLPISLVISFPVGILDCLSCRNDPPERYFGFARCPGDITSLGCIFCLLVNF